MGYRKHTIKIFMYGNIIIKRFGYAIILCLLLAPQAWGFGEMLMPAGRGGAAPGSGWTVGGQTYNSRVKVTTDYTLVDAALTTFPLHLQIDSSAGISGDNMQTILDDLCGGDDNGESRKYKVAVTTSDGSTQLKVEAVNVYCNAGTGEWADYWFEADSISDSAGTDFYFYWDTDTTDNTSYVGSINQDEANANAVWDGQSAVMVHHLNGATVAACDDSSSGGNDIASESGSPDYQQAGTAGYGINFVKASGEYLVVSDNDSLTFGNGSTDSPFSVFAVVRPDSTIDAAVAMIAEKEAEYQFYSVSRKTTLLILDGPAYEWADQAAYTSGSFLTLAATYSGVGGETAQTEIYPYVNGTNAANTNDEYNTYVAMENRATSLFVGKGSLASREWDGIIDELHIYAKEFSAAEVKVLHHAAFDTLLEYGTIETNP